MIHLLLRPLISLIYMFSFVTVIGLSLWLIKDTWMVLLGLVGGALLLAYTLKKK